MAINLFARMAGHLQQPSQAPERQCIGGTVDNPCHEPVTRLYPLRFHDSRHGKAPVEMVVSLCAAHAAAYDQWHEGKTERISMPKDDYERGMDKLMRQAGEYVSDMLDDLRDDLAVRLGLDLDGPFASAWDAAREAALAMVQSELDAKILGDAWDEDEDAEGPAPGVAN